MAEVNDRLSVEFSANIQKLLDGLKSAGDATTVWSEASGRNVQKVSAAFNGVQFEGATSKLKAEMLKQIELTHQLDVARIAGDTKTAESLQEQIALMQRIRQLRSSGFDAPTATAAAGAQAAALAAAAAQARTRREEEEAAEQAAQRRERITGNPGAALESVFSRTRLGVLEEGGAKIPIFGSALEELGGSGLIAAGGLAAAAIAAEQIKKALEFAEDIEKTSKALGVTTTELQELDYAAAGSSVGIGSARQGLQQFNEVFGKYSSGLASGRTAKFLDALGLTPESARQLGSTTEALDLVMSKLAQIKNPQQRASLASQLGLETFLPVLAEGKAGVDEFIESMKQAQGAGAVISPDQIKRAAELNDKLEQIEHVAGTELKQAFIDLGPVILVVAKLVERLARGVDDIIVGLEGIEHADRRQAAAMAGDALGNRSAIYSTGLAGQVDPKTGRASGGLLSYSYNQHDDHYKAANARMAAIDKENADAAKDARGGQAVNLATPKKPKAGPANQTADFDKTAADDQESAARDLASAQAALTKNIEAHAEFEARAVDDEAAKKLTDLSAQEVKIRQSKNDAHKASQLALIETAKTDTQSAAAAKKDLIARNALQARAQADLDDANRTEQLQDRRRTAQASIDPSAQSRANAELQTFRDQQSEALSAERLRVSNKAADDPTYTTGAADVADLQSTQAAELVAKRQQVERSSNPLYAQANPTSTVSDDLVADEAKGVQGLSDDLAGVITQTKTVAEAFHDMAEQIIGDLVKIGLQQYVTQPLSAMLYGNQGGNLGATGGNVSVGFLGSLLGGAGKASSPSGGGDDLTSAFADLDMATKFIPGFATGTDSTPGGLTRYNELGVEGYVPPGAQIIPNATLQALSRMTPGSVGGGGGTNVVQQFHLHAEGAVMTDDLMSNLDGLARAHSAQAVATVRSDQKRADRSARQNLAKY